MCSSIRRRKRKRMSDRLNFSITQNDKYFLKRLLKIYLYYVWLKCASENAFIWDIYTFLQTHLDEFPVSLDMFEISLELMQTIVQSLIDEVSPAMTGISMATKSYKLIISNIWWYIRPLFSHNVSLNLVLLILLHGLYIMPKGNISVGQTLWSS